VLRGLALLFRRAVFLRGVRYCLHQRAPPCALYDGIDVSQQIQGHKGERGWYGCTTVSDQRIECVDCGRVFIWTVGEQQFYRQRGLSAPKRCSECRERRRRAGRGSPLDRPVVRYGLGAFGLAAALALVVWWLIPSTTPVRAWLAAVNLASFCTFAYDKLTAKVNTERVPENVLLVLCAAGGTVGALVGMVVVHHKTAKASFKTQILGILTVQVIVVLVFSLLIA
jgi:uncharacterized membrane protein YsdA (DUF1294 family)